MANIVIKELYDSDDILVAVEKINFNFDQLLLAGGGPAGPTGLQGIQGVAGSKGDRGSQWVAGQGTSTINLPTDGQFRENDFLLNDGGSFVGGPKGQVWYYNNLSTWVDTGINLMGPTGPIGPTGGEGITIIPGAYSSTTNSWQPDPTKLTDYIFNLNTVLTDDSDDSTSSTFIDEGLDFAVLGRGNNSLVLGRYSTLFTQANTSIPELQTPGNGYNSYLSGFPVLNGGGDTPMLVIAQNDYKDPSANSSFTNGISIGLNRSHKQDTYDPEFIYSSNFNYEDHFANISIENRLLDFKIKGTEYGNVNIESSGAKLTLANDAVFATPSTTKRIDINSYSTILESQRYTRFEIEDSLLIDIDPGTHVDAITGAGLITRADFSYFESERKYTPQGTDLRGNTSRTYFTSNNTIPSVNNANEITLINKSTLITNSSTDAEKKGRIENNYSTLKPQIELNADRYEYPFKIGQTFINVPVIGSPSYSDVNLNIKYEGLGYDQNIISYSTNNSATSGSDTINAGSKSSYKGVIANNTDLDEFLYGSGKGITLPISDGDVSMSRMIYRPGFFRDGGKVNEVFDEAHKIMPTGSLDLYGTVRLREQGETDGGLKDGFIATNARDGIVKWEPASSINAVPTGAVIMFSEMSANKFSFFGVSKRTYGYSGTNGTSYRPGGTGIGAVFIGKGSGDLKDYYICNGAILADSRDCWITGPFSKLQGIQTVDGNDNTTVSNPSDLLYERNSEFESKPGASVSFNDAHWYIYNPSITNYQNARDFYLSILNQSSVASDGINAKYKKSWGYSIPGPSTLESGFRVVLPNYFGRFPKMVFPSGEFMTELFYNKGLSETYLDSNNKYNDKFAIRTSFDDLGSPYILKQNLPDTSHFHTIKDIKSEFDGYHQHTIDEVDGHTHLPGTLNITSSGTHNHLSRGTEPMQSDSSGNKAPVIDIGDGGAGGRYELNSIIPTSNGSHTHSSDDFDGETAIGGTHSHTMSIAGSHQHNISQHNTESKTVDNRGYNGTTYNVTDYYTRGNSSTFFANWKTSGQRFFDPPFKGTYFAINLKGLKNPLRANTTIQDLHYVGGIPSCGYSNDTSWFSDTSLQSTSWAQGWFGNNTKPYYNPGGSAFTPDSMDIRAFEYNFREMWRNDNTTHPYNYVVPSIDNRGELYSYDSTDSGTTLAFQNLAYVNNVYNRP